MWPLSVVDLVGRNMDEDRRGFLQADPAHQILDDSDVQPICLIRLQLAGIDVRVASKVDNGARL